MAFYYGLYIQLTRVEKHLLNVLSDIDTLNAASDDDHLVRVYLLNQKTILVGFPFKEEFIREMTKKDVEKELELILASTGSNQSTFLHRIPLEEFEYGLICACACSCASHTSSKV